MVLIGVPPQGADQAMEHSVKDILVHLDGSSEDEIRVTHAEGLLGHFPNARLQGIYTNFLPEYAYNLTGFDGGGPIQAVIALEERLEREGEEKLRTLQARFSRIGSEHDVRKLNARAAKIAPAVASLARWADLVVATTPYRDPMSSWDAVVEAVLFDGGHSLYLVPPGCAVRRELRTLLFAWDDKRESARAASEAMGFMRRAETVRLLHVNPSNSKNAGEEVSDAATHLARHGVTVEVSSISADDGMIGNAILDEATRTSADAIVMGAYGHSRFREWVLGGVTRDLIEGAAVPLIVAH